MSHHSNHNMPPCGRPPQHPLIFGELNYTAEQINALLGMIPFKADRAEVPEMEKLSDVNYLGHVADATLLPEQEQPAWALVGNIEAARPYFYYVEDFVPKGYQQGWNDISQDLGTYDLTALNEVYHTNLLSRFGSYEQIDGAAVTEQDIQEIARIIKAVQNNKTVSFFYEPDEVTFNYFGTLDCYYNSSKTEFGCYLPTSDGYVIARCNISKPDKWALVLSSCDNEVSNSKNYNSLKGRPAINGVTLSGNHKPSELDLATLTEFNTLKKDVTEVSSDAQQKAEYAVETSDEARNISVLAESKSDFAVATSNEAKRTSEIARNAVTTLEGLANATTAAQTLAGQVVQIEENKQNIASNKADADAKLSELGSEVYKIGVPLGTESFSNMNDSEYKIYANIDLKIGSKISLLANGSAEWDSAWVYYNDDVAKKRLIPKVEKGQIYDLTITDEDIYNLGFCISKLTTEGEVTLSVFNNDSIISEIAKELENNIQSQVDEVPLFANYIDLSRKIEIGWLGEETSVKIRKGTSLRIYYKFSNLKAGSGWRLYANDTSNMLAGSSTSLEGEIIKYADFDINKLILYTNAEIEGSADVYIYEVNELEEEVSKIPTYIGTPIGSQEFNNTSATEYKILGDVNLKVGSNILLKVEGSAEWDLAWVYYNDDVGNNRLIYKVEKGKTYDLEITQADIYNIGFCITKLTTAGNVSLNILNMDTFLAEKVKALEDSTTTSSSSIYKGKIGVCMGDSHAQRRAEWVNSVFGGIGAIYDEELTNVIAPQNVTGKGYEDYIDAMYAQAVRAVEQHQQGKQIDLILLDNVHYSTTDDPSKLVPFRPSDVVNIGNNAASSSQEQSWFSANFNSIISTITPKVGTILKSTWSGLVYELTFSGTPNVGEVFVLVIDGESYSTPIESGDSVSSFVARLGEWSFNEQKYLVQVSGNVLKLSYIGQESNPTISISYNAGNSGLVMTTQEKSESSTVYRYYNSLLTSGWNEIGNWTLIWNFDKRCIIGAIEYLMENIPNVVIICVAIPNYRLSKGVFSTQGEFKNSSLYIDGRKRAKYLLDVAELYGLKAIDIEKLWNIALPNWFDYFNENDVHPKSNGYARIADVIISELS